MEGPLPPLPPCPPFPHPPPVLVVVGVFETVAVAPDVKQIGDDIDVSATKFSEQAANTAAADARRKLFLRPASLLFLLADVPHDGAVEVSRKDDDAPAGRLWIQAVVDKTRHAGPRTLAAAETANDGCRDDGLADAAEEDVEIVLLLRARHDDDKRAERVAVHATQDAIIVSVSNCEIY